MGRPDSKSTGDSAMNYIEYKNKGVSFGIDKKSNIINQIYIYIKGGSSVHALIR